MSRSTGVHTLTELLSALVSVDLTNGESLSALPAEFAVFVQCMSVVLSVALAVLCRLHD